MRKAVDHATDEKMPWARYNGADVAACAFGSALCDWILFGFPDYTAPVKCRRALEVPIDCLHLSSWLRCSTSVGRPPLRQLWDR